MSYTALPSPLMQLDAVISWLETQDPKTTYQYLHNHDCLYSRYLRSRGLCLPHVGVRRYWDRDDPGVVYFFPDFFEDIAHGNLGFFAAFRTKARQAEWCYGAALARAKKIREELDHAAEAHFQSIPRASVRGGRGEASALPA